MADTVSPADAGPGHNGLPKLDHRNPFSDHRKEYRSDRRRRKLGKIQTALMGSIDPVLTAPMTRAQKRMARPACKGILGCAVQKIRRIANKLA